LRLGKRLENLEQRVDFPDPAVAPPTSAGDNTAEGV
jgi:hypothetical protein